MGPFDEYYKQHGKHHQKTTLKTPLVEWFNRVDE